MRKKILFLILAALPVVIGIAGIAALLGMPHTGIGFEAHEGKWFLAHVAPPGPSANLTPFTGMAVTAIADRELGPFDLVEDFDYIPDRESLVQFWRAQIFFASHVRPGTPVSIAFRDGSKATFTPGKTTFPRVIGRVGMMFFLGLFSLFVGLGVVLKKPDDERAVVFFFMVLSVGLIFLTFGSYTSRDIAMDMGVFTVFRVVNIVAFSFFPVLFLHFCLVFPERKKIVNNRAFLPVLYSLPLIVSAVYQPRISFASLQVLFLGGLVAGVASIVYGSIRAKTPRERYQIRWVLFGVGVFVAVFSATTLIPNIVLGHRLTSDRVPSFFFIFIPLSMAVAITRYRLMDIDTVFDTTVAYSLTLGVLALVDLGVLYAINVAARGAVPSGGPLAVVTALWFALLAYSPVRNLMTAGVKRVLRRDMYDPQAVTMKLGSRLVDSHDVRTAAGSLVQAVAGVFRPIGLSVYLFRENPDLAIEVVSEGPVTPPPFDLTAEIVRAGGPVPLYSLPTADTISADMSGGVLVPLVSQAGTAGCLLLMNKRSGRLYTTADMKLLKVLADITAMTMEALLRKEESDRREREARRERERISREIHDGIGSNFTNAIMMIDLLGKEPSAADRVRDRLGNLKSLLADGLTGLRDLIWTIEEADCTAGDLAAHIRDTTERLLRGEEMELSMDTEIRDEGMPLSALIRLNIIRIVQESVTNALKHSRATRLRITVSQKPGELSVVVSDNGAGFDTSQPRKGGYGLRNIKKRCEEMGGTCALDSIPGEGTRLCVKVRTSQ